MYFLGGMALPIVIALIYLGIHGAIGDFIRVYFIINLTSYSNEASIAIASSRLDTAR